MPARVLDNLLGLTTPQRVPVGDALQTCPHPPHRTTSPAPITHHPLTRPPEDIALTFLKQMWPKHCFRSQYFTAIPPNAGEDADPSLTSAQGPPCSDCRLPPISCHAPFHTKLFLALLATPMLLTPRTYFSFSSTYAVLRLRHLQFVTLSNFYSSSKFQFQCCLVWGLF